MEGFLGQKDAMSSLPAATARVLGDARRSFGERFDDSVLERCANEAVASLWQETIRVKAFVPVLALRQIREMLETDDRDGAERATSVI